MPSKSSIKFNPSLKDEDKGYQVVAAAAVMTALIILSTTARVSMKLYHRIRFQAEDFLIVLGLALNIAGNCVEFEAVKHGFGRHLQFLDREQEREVKMWNQLGIFFANMAIFSVKVSICCFILTLIRGAFKQSSRIVWLLITITATAHGGQLIFWATQAQPLKKIWEPEVPGTVTKRSVLVNSIYAFTVISSVTDLFYAIAPLYFFWGLQITMKRKLAIFGMTGSGLLVFTASIVRLTYVKEFFNPDMSWALRPVYICTVIERNLAQVIADLPAIFPLLRSAHNKVRGIITQNSRSTSSGGTGRARSTLVTIGSVGKRTKGEGSQSEFSAYGNQFKGVKVGSDDEIPLNGVAHHPGNDRRIVATVDIDVSSQKTEVA